MTPRRIRALRRKLDLTQVGLAVRLGTTSTTIARWERGERSPAPAMLARIKLLRTGKCPTCGAGSGCRSERS